MPKKRKLTDAVQTKGRKTAQPSNRKNFPNDNAPKKARKNPPKSQLKMTNTNKKNVTTKKQRKKTKTRTDLDNVLSALLRDDGNEGSANAKDNGSVQTETNAAQKDSIDTVQTDSNHNNLDTVGDKSTKEQINIPSFKKRGRKPKNNNLKKNGEQPLCSLTSTTDVSKTTEQQVKKKPGRKPKDGTLEKNGQQSHDRVELTTSTEGIPTQHQDPGPKKRGRKRKADKPESGANQSLDIIIDLEQPAAKRKSSGHKEKSLKRVDSVSSRSSVRSFSSCEFDPNLDKDDLDGESSFEDDLPDFNSVMNSPSKTATSKLPFKTSDIVWVKHQLQPFWPAVVLNVYKRKTPVKMSFYFVGDPSLEFHGKRFSRSYDKKKILPYPGNQYQALVAEGSSTPYFNESVDKADSFIRKRALGLIPEDPLKFFLPELKIIDAPSEEVDEAVSVTPSDDGIGRLEESVDDDSKSDDLSVSSSVSTPPKLSEKGQKSVDRRDAVNQRLLDIIATEKMKAHLHAIFQSKTPCRLHDIFTSDDLDVRNYAPVGFGPISDDKQIDCLMDILTKWYREWKPKDRVNETSYVMDVMAPEALTKGLQIQKRIPRAKAEELVRKGPRMFIEEHQRNHKLILEAASNIDPEDKARYTARTERMMRDFVQGR